MIQNRLEIFHSNNSDDLNVCTMASLYFLWIISMLPISFHFSKYSLNKIIMIQLFLGVSNSPV